MRATRDRLRRRCHLGQKRAELLAHSQHPNRQDPLPEIGKKLAYKANREGVEAPFPDPSVRKPIAGDLSRIAHYDQWLGAGELSMTRTAKTHEVQPCARLQSVPGLGQILALVSLSEIQDLARLPRVPDFVSSCRLVHCAKESGGERLGTSGKKMGNAHWRWAFAAAAVLFLRQKQPGKEDFTKLEHKPGKAKALTVLAQKRARAVYDLLTRAQAVDLKRFVTASPLRGESEPAVYLAHPGRSLLPAPALYSAACAGASGPETRSPRLCLDRLSRSLSWGLVTKCPVAAPPPRLPLTGRVFGYHPLALHRPG